eukprot:3062064-Prorocentrum_lima.AAC.1
MSRHFFRTMRTGRRIFASAAIAPFEEPYARGEKLRKEPKLTEEQRDVLISWAIRAKKRVQSRRKLVAYPTGPAKRYWDGWMSLLIAYT